MPYHGSYYNSDAAIFIAIFGYIFGAIIVAIVILAANGCFSPDATDSEPNAVPTVTVAIGVEQESLLSELNGIELPIPLSKKEIRIQALKDEALALVQSLGCREKSAIAEEKKLQIAIEASGKIASSFTGWKSLGDEIPPKGVYVLIYDRAFHQKPYQVMKFVQKKKDVLIFEADLFVNSETPQTYTMRVIPITRSLYYWTTFDNFCGKREKYFTNCRLRRGLTLDEVFNMYGEPSSATVSKGRNNDRETWFYDSHNDQWKSNMLWFDDGMLISWKLNFSFREDKK